MSWNYLVTTTNDWSHEVTTTNDWNYEVTEAVPTLLITKSSRKYIVTKDGRSIKTKL